MKTDFNFSDYIYAQRRWSEQAFGPIDAGDRTPGILKHLRKEIGEVAAAPKDVLEWVDIIILALDGAWRNGYSAEFIIAALEEKQRINMHRKWPDWTTVASDQPIEHTK